MALPRRLTASLSIVVLAMVIACGRSPRKLSVTVAAPQCGGGYDLENAAVTVRNEKGTVIGTGATGRNIAPGPAAYCQVDATLVVPKASFYQLAIGTHEAPSYSFADLQARGFKVDLNLGNPLR